VLDYFTAKTSDDLRLACRLTRNGRNRALTIPGIPEGSWENQKSPTRLLPVGLSDGSVPVYSRDVRSSKAAVNLAA